MDDSTSRFRLLGNINFIVDSAYGSSQNSPCSLSKKHMIESIEMSYVTYLRVLRKLQTTASYSPQDRTLLKFVRLFNQEWTPEIDVSVLKRKDLALEVDSGVYTRRQHFSQELRWYCGCYFCYSFNSYGKVTCGLLNVYSCQSDYHVQLINGFVDEADLDAFLGNSGNDLVYRRLHRKRKLEEFFDNPATVRQRFLQDQSLPAAPKHRHVFYSGEVEIYAHSLLLGLLPMDSSYKMLVFLKRPPSLNDSPYPGGLGASVCLAFELHSRISNTMRFVGLSRDYLLNTDGISRILQIQAENKKILNLSAGDPLWWNLLMGEDPGDPELWAEL